MSLANEAVLVAELLERQFDVVIRQAGTRKLRDLRRLIRLVQDEPVLSAVIADLKNEADVELAGYANRDQSVRTALKELWAEHGSQLKADLAMVEDDTLEAFGSIDDYSDALDRLGPLKWDEPEDYWLPALTGSRIRALSRWSKHADDVANGTNDLNAKWDDLRSKLVDLEREHAHAYGQLKDAKQSLGWPAYVRLASACEALNPPPPSPDEEHGSIRYHIAVELADDLERNDEVKTLSRSTQRAREFFAQVEEDLDVLREEIALRIGRQRSRLAVVKRYAAGCEAFRAEEMRSMVEALPRPEDRLTLDFARYLFETGLNPLIDANVSSLKPDILHLDPGALFYVEAKQYNEEHPRSKLIDAYKQVWSTWSRIRKRYPSKEAFLVVFRRGGPFVELPDVITEKGLKLYSILADISTEAGSKEKFKTVTISAEEVQPEEGEAA